jgi:HEAT repeat protein
MKVVKTIRIFTLFASMAFTASAGLEVDNLDAFIKEQGNYTYGNSGNSDQINWMVTQVAMASKDDSARGRIEQSLIDTLAAATTYDAKDLLCRQLRTIGSAKSVPVLAAMLTDAETSHLARHALGRIDAPEAGAALQAAIERTNGKIQAGIINTLVKADYVSALPQFKRLVTSSDKDIAIASAKALAHFAGDDAVKTLQDARKSSPVDIQAALNDALLICAEKFTAEGRMQKAANIYNEFNSVDYSDKLRIAALAGLTKTDASKSFDLLSKAIKGDNAALRSHAISIMGTIPGKKTTDTLVGFLNSIPADGQEMVIVVLNMRGDSSESPVFVDYLESQHENVRMASLVALGSVGTPGAIKALADFAAAASNLEKRQARESLVAMRGEGMDEAFIAESMSGRDAKRREVIRAIGQRKGSIAFDTLNRIAESESNNDVRTEAILSMGRIGRQDNLGALVHLVISPNDPVDRAALEKAIFMIFSNGDDETAQAALIIATLQNAPNDAKPVLLSLLSKPATPGALEEVRKALNSSDNTVKDGAIRSLAKWTTIAAREDLYRIASTSHNQVHKTLTFRGYVDLAQYADDAASMYEKAAHIAKNQAEIHFILAGLGKADTRKAFELAEQHLNNDATKAEAYLAAVKILGRYCWQSPEFAEPRLQHISANAPNDTIMNMAQEILCNMEKYKGRIFAWKTSGLYKAEGVQGEVIFSNVYEPETNPDSINVKWSPLIVAVHDGKLDLEKTFGSVDNCSTYLRTYIISPSEQEVKFQLEADDRIKAWVNGEAIDRTAKLRQGANTIMLKVGEIGGGWNFECKIMKQDGSQIEGLSISTTSGSDVYKQRNAEGTN